MCSLFRPQRHYSEQMEAWPSQALSQTFPFLFAFYNNPAEPIPLCLLVRLRSSITIFFIIIAYIYSSNVSTNLAFFKTELDFYSACINALLEPLPLLNQGPLPHRPLTLSRSATFPVLNHSLFQFHLNFLQHVGDEGISQSCTAITVGKVLRNVSLGNFVVVWTSWSEFTQT